MLSPLLCAVCLQSGVVCDGWPTSAVVAVCSRVRGRLTGAWRALGGAWHDELMLVGICMMVAMVQQQRRPWATVDTGGQVTCCEPFGTRDTTTVDMDPQPAAIPTTICSAADAAPSASNVGTGPCLSVTPSPSSKPTVLVRTYWFFTLISLPTSTPAVNHVAQPMSLRST